MGPRIRDCWRSYWAPLGLPLGTVTGLLGSLLGVVRACRWAKCEGERWGRIGEGAMANGEAEMTRAIGKGIGKGSDREGEEAEGGGRRGRGQLGKEGAAMGA